MFRRNIMALIGVAAPISLALAACAGEGAAMAEKSLHQRLGGTPAITAVVDEFIVNVAADKRINMYFGGDIPRLKRLLVEQICEGAGGTCKYTGRSMKDVHARMGLEERHFNALVEDLVKALDKFKVPAKEKTELLNILGPMKADIVTM